MDLLISGGDYVPDGSGGFDSATGAAGVLQRALFRLSVPRGSFLPLPDLGSNLHLLFREKSSAWEALATQYVRQALEEESDLWVNGVTVTEIEQGKILVEAELLWQGEPLSLSTTLG